MGGFSFLGCVKLIEIIFPKQRIEQIKNRPQHFRKIAEKTGRPLELQVYKFLEEIKMLPAGERKREVLIDKCGLINGKTKTLEEVGRNFGGVTRQRIELMLKIIRIQIKEPPELPISRHLEPYLQLTVGEAEKVFQKFEEKEKEKRDRDDFYNILLSTGVKRLRLNRIMRSGITLSQLRELSEEELIARLGMKKKGKTTKVLLELQQNG